MSKRLLFHAPPLLVDDRNFVYLFGPRRKLCRFIPERQTLEFKDHHKGGQITEVKVDAIINALQRLVEEK